MEIVSGDDMMRALMAHVGANSGTQQGNSMRTDKDRAVPLLRDALSAWNAPNPFKHGDIIKVAQHSAIWKASMGHSIVVFTHKPESEFDENVVQSFNMRILALQDNGAAVEYRAHSRDFELVEAAR